MRFALALALAATGCIKKEQRDPDVERMREFKNLVCACKDLACVEKATATFAKDSSAPSTSKAAQEYAEAAQHCIMKVAGVPREPAVPSVPSSRHADVLIAAARTWQSDAYPTLAIAGVRIAYVEESGMLDAEHGVVAVGLGKRSAIDDDPKRKTGAPLPATWSASDCPVVTFAKDSWQYHTEPCDEVPARTALCTVQAAWQRAIDEAKAPTDALAVLQYRNAPQASWTFTITDEPRNVNVSHTFADDCAPLVESQ